jgi:acetyl-CoA carboxylase carboxyl transferase subunit alpha
MMAQRVKEHIVEQVDNLQQLPLEDLLNKRYQRLMSYGT